MRFYRAIQQGFLNRPPREQAPEHKNRFVCFFEESRPLHKKTRVQTRVFVKRALMGQAAGQQFGHGARMLDFA